MEKFPQKVFEDFRTKPIIEIYYQYAAYRDISELIPNMILENIYYKNKFKGVLAAFPISNDEYTIGWSCLNYKDSWQFQEKINRKKLGLIFAIKRGLALSDNIMYEIYLHHKNRESDSRFNKLIMSGFYEEVSKITRFPQSFRGKMVTFIERCEQYFNNQNHKDKAIAMNEFVYDFFAEDIK